MGAEGLGEAARRGAELAVQEADDAVGQVGPGRVASQLGGRDVRGHEMQGEVADNLRRRRDLDGAAEQVVARGIQPLDLLEAVSQAQRPCLRPQVRQLPAGNLVAIDGARG